jgi:replication initiation protein RepC
VQLLGRVPRSPTLKDIESVLNEMRMLREEIINQLEIQEDS